MEMFFVVFVPALENGSHDFAHMYLAHVIEQPIFRIPNLEYLQRNFCFDFF